MPKPPPPPLKQPPKAAPPAPASQARSNMTRSVTKGASREGEKVLIYGAGKVGKTTLASVLGEVGRDPLFIDIGDSTSHMDVMRVSPSPTNYLELREVLQDQSIWEQARAIVVDDMTTADEMAVAHVLGVKKLEGGTKADGIEDYGWGKGYVHAFEACLGILGDLDRIARSGRDVVVISHVITEIVKNPDGTDFQQYQPRLRSNKNAQFRQRVMEWCYHCLYLQMDVFASKTGKGTGGGSRSIYCAPAASHWAGSRSIPVDRIDYPQGDDYAVVWRHIFNRQGDRE